ncbi:MAG: MBL fold metallo-hydrolase, partial [Romboutsia sp.]
GVNIPILPDVCPFKSIIFNSTPSGSIGILTPDKVFFIGDLLVGIDTLSKFDFLFTFDIKDYLESLHKLNSIDFEYLVLGHSKKVISKDESYSLIKKHKDATDKYINQIISELEEPIVIDNLLKNIIVKNNLRNNYKEYHFFKSSLISVISYLADLDKIDYLLENGQLYYYTKRK